MPFRKPVSTQGGLTFWTNIKQDSNFIMQKHKTGLWPYKYRILMRENSKEIANANDQYTIDLDWEYLQNNAVPRLHEQGFLDINKIIEDIIKSKI
ncbi:hypothetical protein [Bacillus sp. V5-8f]|uniref:hypothetical protein n=1 Tax=Bacillus sp. V5-8f TaxID=2053044 RepID=UPI000C7917FA|nr:hypothetical protein [Bacillus sp. V5-8f]PLT32088.1 hypothetical protein CUU64_21215 [Bacillus sp. V5-8f]